MCVFLLCVHTYIVSFLLLISLLRLEAPLGMCECVCVSACVYVCVCECVYVTYVCVCVCMCVCECACVCGDAQGPGGRSLCICAIKIIIGVSEPSVEVKCMARRLVSRPAYFFACSIINWESGVGD